MDERSGGSPSQIEIGYVARAHGVRGELRVHTYTPGSTVLLDVSSAWIGVDRFEVVRARPVDGAILITVRGVSDRTAADALRQRKVSVARDDLDLDEDDVLLADLVGCAAVLPDGSPWGTIAAIDVGPQDRLVIHDGDVERLLPVVDAFIVEVDLDARRVVVDPPEDLPDSPLR